MPKPAKGARLGSGPDHEKLLLAGLASALITEERIRTTQAKARRVRPLAEKLITLGKDGGVHARRQVLQVIPDRDVVHRLFDEVAPRFADRNGGYTRVLKLGPRKGDAAPMVILELVEGERPARRAREAADQEPKRRGVLRRRRGAAAGAAEKEAPNRGPEPERPSNEGERASKEREQVSPESARAADDADPASKD